MRKLAITALAIALGLAWSTLPAVAAGTTPKEEDKSVKEKAVETKDKVKEKTSEAWDKTKEKTSEAWDKTKEKTTEAKDKADSKMEKAKDKMRAAKDKVEAKMDMAEVRSAQQALKDKGHDPGPIDGIHGPRTTAALKSYQKAENITVTGRLDDETKARLMGRQASSTTSAPAASPATGQPSVGSTATSQPTAPPASGQSPSAPAQQPEKAQKP